MKRVIIAAFLTCSLTACSVGPDYEPPQVPTEKKFMGEAAANVSPDPINLYWWRGFSDPILDELILHAVRDNFTLQAAVARINQARAMQQQSLLNLFPTVTASADFTDQRFGNQGAFGGLGGQNRRAFEVEVYQAGFDASWELDFFGRVRRGLEQSQGESEASIADLEDAIRVLVSEVAKTYFELRGYQEQTKVAQQNADNQNQVVSISDALFKGGQNTEFDLMRSKALLFSTLATVPTFQSNSRAAMYRLAVLLGKQPHELLSKLETRIPFPEYKGPISLGEPAALLQRRPDVRAAERRLAAATAGIGVAKGDFFPKVSFIGSVSVQSRNFRDLLDNSGESWSFGPRITWAAFDLPRVFARVDAAEEFTKEALATYQQTVLTALEDVEGALVRFSAAKERRDLLLKGLEESQKAVVIAKTQYENGLIDLLPVLDAQRSAFITQEQLTSSQTDLLLSLVSLYKALSGGWDGELSAPKDAEVPEVGLDGTKPLVIPVSASDNPSTELVAASTSQKEVQTQ
jgi:multidrug efflux system outer membrane protein